MEQYTQFQLCQDPCQYKTNAKLNWSEQVDKVPRALRAYRSRFAHIARACLLHFVIGFSKFPSWSAPHSRNNKSTSATRLYEFEVDREYFKEISSKNDSFSDDFHESYPCLAPENI